MGVAGWDYDDWRGVFYPDRAPRGFDRLKYLARFVDLVEVNSTFYGPARRESALRWAERAEQAEAEVAERSPAHAQDGFCFSAKLWRRFTHERNEAWTRDEANQVKAGLYALQHQARLSAVLVQFPWSFRNTPENREWLDDVRCEFVKFPLVVEVRHESWLEPDFLGWLGEHGIGFVNIDQPQFSNSVAPSARSSGRTGYIRVHGRNYRDWFRKGAGRDERYDYLYDTDELKPWVERAQRIAEADVSEVDVVFNNHYRAQAVANAVQFEAMLGRDVVAPPELFDAYGDVLDAAGVRPAEV